MSGTKSLGATFWCLAVAGLVSMATTAQAEASGFVAKEDAQFVLVDRTRFVWARIWDPNRALESAYNPADDLTYPHRPRGDQRRNPPRGE